MKKEILVFLVALMLTPLSLSSQQINWVSIEEAEKMNKEKPKKIMVDVYTDWCGWCKKMDKDTFSNPVIAEIINEHYYAVKLNAEGKDEIIFNGTTYKFIAQGSRGYHDFNY